MSSGCIQDIVVEDLVKEGREKEGRRVLQGIVRRFCWILQGFEEEGAAVEGNRWHHWKEEQKLGRGAHQGVKVLEVNWVQPFNLANLKVVTTLTLPATRRNTGGSFKEVPDLEVLFPPCGLQADWDQYKDMELSGRDARIKADYILKYRHMQDNILNKHLR
ncbi:hypothetical protein BY996DRAFT_6539269 [Phakopsora pachyrhizi]|nr:hypothetical protein BY996DRAFT_6539269 [Phakopsora pachyrhizi]